MSEQWRLYAQGILVHHGKWREGKKKLPTDHIFSGTTKIPQTYNIIKIESGTFFKKHSLEALVATSDLTERQI